MVKTGGTKNEKKIIFRKIQASGAQNTTQRPSF